MDALVVGAGTMGRWLGGVLRDAPDAGSLAVVDADREAAQAAAAALDCRVLDADDDDTFDIVCFAVPISAATDAIGAHADRADRTVVDVTGTMAEPLAAMAEHAPACARASLHPLFSPANEPGAVPTVTDEPGRDVETITAALESRGSHVFETTASEHDEAMETVQAKTHAAVLAYGLAGDDVDPAFHTPVSSVLDELVAQVTEGEPGVYAEIQAEFDGAAAVAEAAREVATADRAAFEALYQAAGDGEDDT